MSYTGSEKSKIKEMVGIPILLHGCNIGIWISVYFCYQSTHIMDIILRINKILFLIILTCRDEPSMLKQLNQMNPTKSPGSRNNIMAIWHSKMFWSTQYPVNHLQIMLLHRIDTKNKRTTMRNKFFTPSFPSGSFQIQRQQL